ncbi:Gfo/Idh/MocA family oxidoreductase [Maribellus sp. YY47]|uniref:Gfo/Idh/MocA family protein n=1 Tax=Maribellus sp. YY47 TaxID=2929486 RepID=UPI002000D6D2|nr:Gfo/Idh/MocA family oxidoreductase [Maribellus sp. YY47]MCK3685702.1 Gfo/Idh/MocA family oxidoreductase [Maribellus sp. YY47]
MTISNRRSFLKTTTAAGVGLFAAPHIAKAGLSKKSKNGEVNIAFIGVGGRGRGHVHRAAITEGVKVTAFCDIDPAAVASTKKMLSDLGKPEPAVYSDGEYAYLEMLKREDIDGVIIATPWLWHTRMAVATMKAGKYAAVEVSAANTIEECWDLVNTSEATGMPCMILENVNYRRDAMAVMNMVKQGIFGEVVHARCGYRHSLLDVKFNQDLKFGEGAQGEARWRTQHSLKRNADVYPTHGLGPVAAMLDINRGNRFLYLTSTATKAVGLKDYIEEKGGKDHPYAQLPWKQGDIITSVIKTTNGETIIVTHDCNLPRPYSLNFHVAGTDGVTDFDYGTRRIHIEGQSPAHTWDDFQAWQDKYDHPLWKKYGEIANGSGHGGIDYFVTREFINSVKEQRQPVMDVYDAAAWSAVTPLSEASIATGSSPQYFPDFTRGQWINRKPVEFV